MAHSDSDNSDRLTQESSEANYEQDTHQQPSNSYINAIFAAFTLVIFALMAIFAFANLDPAQAITGVLFLALALLLTFRDVFRAKRRS